MIKKIKEAAKKVGIVAVITNSEERLETQLNRLTAEEHLPLLLISWDVDVFLSFNSNGHLRNPDAQIVALLVSKPEDLSKSAAETTSEEMAVLFEKFLEKLNSLIAPLINNEMGAPISNASYKYVPRHGAGKHSGILARWNQKRILKSNC